MYYFVCKSSGDPRLGPYTFEQLRSMWAVGEINTSSVVYPDTTSKRDDRSYGFNPHGTTGEALRGCMEIDYASPSVPAYGVQEQARTLRHKPYDMETIREQTQFEGLRWCAMGMKVCGYAGAVLNVAIPFISYGAGKALAQRIVGQIPGMPMVESVMPSLWISVPLSVLAGIVCVFGGYCSALVLSGLADHLDMKLIQINGRSRD